MSKSKLLIAAAVASLSGADLLRGKPESDAPKRSLPSGRQLPTKIKDLKKLKRLNIERKHLNQSRVRVANANEGEAAAAAAAAAAHSSRDKQTFSHEKEEWKNLSKEEKKSLLEELKEEETDWNDELDRGDMSKQDWKEMIKAQESVVEKTESSTDKPEEDDSNENDLISQYTTLLNVQINPNNLNGIWKALSKEEKKQLLALQEGKLIIEGDQVVDNPEYSVDKLSKEEKKELAKLDKDEGEEVDKPNSEGDEPKPKDDEGKENDMDTNSSAANTLVKPEGNEPDIASQPDPETVTTSTTEKPAVTTTTTTTTTTEETKKEDMKPNSNPVNTSNNANDFVIPMPSLTYSSSTTTTTSSTTTATSTTVDSNTCKDCFEFATELQDPSTPLDGSELKWTMDGLPWSTFTKCCYNSDSCVASGITGGLGLGEPVYSNLTFTTEDQFDGGILTFYLKGDGLQMPNEAFFVSVDGKIASSALSEGNDDWTEYGVVVGRGGHVVTWTHVYNPLGLEALPPNEVGGLVVDDLRYSPFQKVGRGIDQGFEDNEGKGLEITSDGDAAWVVDDKASNSGSYSIVAKTKNINADSGSSNVHFVLHSQYGGTLKYKIATSTTAPHDDFAVLLNGKPVQALFGVSKTLPNFEFRELDIPMGKVVVTFQHRKNPGNFSRSVLDALGQVETSGQTRLDDIRFQPFSDRS
jgi:hypothetical protein